MTERERLVELLKEVVAIQGSSFGPDDPSYETVAGYLLANGVIVPPCKIGDTMWAIRDFKGIKHPQEGIVSDMYFTKDMSLHIVVKYVARGEFGKTVFLTEEEAQAALAAKNNK